MLIGRAQIEALIPHAGTMCLLDSVESWDEETILCSTRSHLAASNPLRCGEMLAAIHGAEYGAQAMAVHGGLLAQRDGEKPVAGYLAALRDVRWEVDDLAQVAGTLQVSARQLMRGGGNMMYEFAVSCDGRLIVSGRATVMSGEGAMQ